MLRGRRAPDYSGDPTDIRRGAMELLSRREFCVAELRTRLAARFGAQAPIDAEIERLVTDGLLSDQRFAEAFVRMHRNKGHGPLRILRDLEQRGVDSELAAATVDPKSRDWHQLARTWQRRRFGNAVPPSAAEWQRQARHLQQRGFSSEQVRFALSEREE